MADLDTRLDISFGAVPAPAAAPRLVPCTETLLRAIRPGAAEIAALGGADLPPLALGEHPAWACLEGDVALGAGGAFIRGAFAGAWLWLSDDARKRPRLLLRCAKSFLAGLEHDLGVTVIRAHALAADRTAARFLKHLHFDFVGIHPGHGPTRALAGIYERRAA